MMNVYFDSDAFLAVIAQEKQARGLSWFAVARESGVNTSTIGRALQPGHLGLSAHAIGALACWAGIADIRPFVKRFGGELDPLALPPGYCVRQRKYHKQFFASYNGRDLTRKDGKPLWFYSEARAIAHCREHAKLRGAS